MELPIAVRPIVNEYLQGPHIRDIINNLQSDVFLGFKLRSYGFFRKTRGFRTRFHHEGFIIDDNYWPNLWFLGPTPIGVRRQTIQNLNNIAVDEVMTQLDTFRPSSTLEVLLVIRDIRGPQNAPLWRKTRLFEIKRNEFSRQDYLDLLQENAHNSHSSTPTIFIRPKNTLGKTLQQRTRSTKSRRKRPKTARKSGKGRKCKR